MEKNWIKLFVSNNPIQVEIYKQMLEEHDIPAVVMNKRDSSYTFGNLEIYVHESNEAEARLLLAAHPLPTDEDE